MELMIAIGFFGALVAISLHKRQEKEKSIIK